MDRADHQIYGHSGGEFQFSHDFAVMDRHRRYDISPGDVGFQFSHDFAVMDRQWENLVRGLFVIGVSI